MADAKKLKRFHVEQSGEGFQMDVEDDSGHILSLTATREQVDLIADKLDEMLSESDDDDVVDED
jgi:hypothetical protein